MSTTSFIDFDAGHRDLVTVTRFNFYGNRIVTASSDHRIKVWDQKDGGWQLIDTWGAHDAEIRDVRKDTLSEVAWKALLICERLHGMAHLLANISAVLARI
jgi:WD40 repeat protein